MKETLTEQVYNNIKNDIVELNYHVNDLLIEREIADKYSVSRAPVREALHRLCQEGYLKSCPRRGYAIISINDKDLYQLQELRYYMESMSVEYIIKNCTDDEIRSLHETFGSDDVNIFNFRKFNNSFHLRMAEFTGNHYLIDYLKKMMDSIPRIVNFANDPVLNMNAPTLQYFHGQIINALLERDVEKARALLKKDLVSTKI